MTERTQNDSAEEQAVNNETAGLWFSFKRFLVRLVAFLRNVLNLREGVDYEGTTQAIRQDVNFKGHAAWVLICSIIIASIGLNTNSTAVIIGAMLISPLMGPILAIGMAIAINDFELLKRSVKNFTIAVGLSIFISMLYFMATPFKDASPELMDRRTATVLALGIALFGGAAGIIASSRPIKSNVVPGVAIATALMPPLCTAGYGLATLQWDYFFGAFYLFFINSVFIALPTYLYMKYMKFPVVQFVDPRREKKIRRNILIFLIVIIIPSGVIFVQVIKQSLFYQRSNSFITMVEDSLKGTDTAIITRTTDYKDGEPEIKLALMGELVPEKKVDAWKMDLEKFNLSDIAFSVVQSKDYMSAIQDLEEKTSERGVQLLEGMIASRDREIQHLNSELAKFKKDDLDFGQLEKESRILFKGVEKLMYTDGVESDFNSIDTVHTLFVRFNADVDLQQREQERAKIAEWLKVQLNKEEVRVIEY